MVSVGVKSLTVTSSITRRPTVTINTMVTAITSNQSRLQAHTKESRNALRASRPEVRVTKYCPIGINNDHSAGHVFCWSQCRIAARVTMTGPESHLPLTERRATELQQVARSLHTRDYILERRYDSIDELLHCVIPSFNCITGRML